MVGNCPRNRRTLHRTQVRLVAQMASRPITHGYGIAVARMLWEHEASVRFRVPVRRTSWRPARFVPVRDRFDSGVRLHGCLAPTAERMLEAHRDRGSSPRTATSLQIRLTVGRRPLKPLVVVRIHHLELNPGSFNGRTTGCYPVYRGSSPRPGARR